VGSGTEAFVAADNIGCCLGVPCLFVKKVNRCDFSGNHPDRIVLTVDFASQVERCLDKLVGFIFALFVLRTAVGPGLLL
jgi:hypothetical protein